MTCYEEMEKLLTKNIMARERSNKGRAIRVLLLEKYPKLGTIPKDVMLSAIKSMESYDRAWRKVTKDNKKLRGSDYGDKDELEDQKLEELGYETRKIIIT